MLKPMERACCSREQCVANDELVTALLDNARNTGKSGRAARYEFYSRLSKQHSRRFFADLTNPPTRSRRSTRAC